MAGKRDDQKRSGALDETAPSKSVARGPALPFTKPERGASEPAPREAAPRSVDSATPTAGPRSSPQDPLPFEPTGDPAEQLTLEQHASLHVELEMAPKRKLETLQRYNIKPDRFRLVDGAWRKRLASDPAQKAKWDAAQATYRAWLRR